jgi:hypothetical protein
MAASKECDGTSVPVARRSANLTGGARTGTSASRERAHTFTHVAVTGKWQVPRRAGAIQASAVRISAIAFA